MRETLAINGGEKAVKARLPGWQRCSMWTPLQPAVAAEAGVRSQKVLTTCYESARTGRAVGV
jgi:hypothetical protein